MGKTDIPVPSKVGPAGFEPTKPKKATGVLPALLALRFLETYLLPSYAASSIKRRFDIFSNKCRDPNTVKSSLPESNWSYSSLL